MKRQHFIFFFNLWSFKKKSDFASWKVKLLGIVTSCATTESEFI